VVLAREFCVRTLSLAFADSEPAVLGRVHGGVGGVQEVVRGGAVLGVEGDAEAGRALQGVAFEKKRIVEAVFQSPDDLIDAGAVAHRRQQHGKLIAAQPRQQVAGAQLPLQPQRHFLQIQISKVMAVKVIDLLELVQVDVDQPEDAGILARLVNLGVQARSGCGRR